ncbi:MAG: Gfo/Idh/MocA family oxidoreductase, partial [Planctomycetes bacterium]|nr:Gfo/Idh/MocA family oxidoreductase [Planctomycetota bacterium]
MQRIKLGVIGCGVMGVRHVKAAQDSGEFEVIAVADLREQLAKDAAAKHSVPKVYGNGDALLDDSEVEAVVLAMPAFARTPLALHAFRNGKHVLTEKPVAMNAQEVERMIEARGKLTAGCCSPRFRLTQSAEAATAFVATGALGPLRVVRCRALSAAGKPPQATPPAWRLKKSLNGGGILLNWGCYDLDYLLGITGWTLKPKLVLAQTWTVPPQFESHIAPGSDAETYFTAFI